MIVELSVENVAIIERATLPLGPGFTVLTGETGAGKSLMIDAIELALGERADFDLVRSGARSANVNVVFDLSSRPELIEKCGELGITVEDSMLYIHRELVAEGRSQCRIGGKLMPVGVLKQLGSLLIDLHGQHDHQALLMPERHVDYLDAWIGSPASAALAAVRSAYQTMSDARKRLDSVRSGMMDREQKLDLLRFQVREIEEAGPQTGELEELEALLSRLKNVERLANASFSALESLTEGETNATDLLSSATSGLGAVERFDPALVEITESLNSAIVTLQDGTHSLRAYAEGLEADPSALDDTAARIDLLRRLRRKYGADEAEILMFLHEAKLELDLLEGSDESEEELDRRFEEANASLLDACGVLAELRRERAGEFDSLVANELSDLGMERAVFRTHSQPREPDATGSEDVQFYFSANRGEPEKPLSRIASGGEMSRVMLAIKSSLAGRAGVPTLIFDEIDAGLGGRAAATVAAKLEELATHYQVVVITHLAQIASRATANYRIEKQESAGRVVAHVRRLSQEERVEEIARMLAGETVTQSALANAREMLETR